MQAKIESTNKEEVLKTLEPMRSQDYQVVFFGEFDGSNHSEFEIYQLKYEKFIQEVSDENLSRLQLIINNSKLPIEQKIIDEALTIASYKNKLNVVEFLLNQLKANPLVDEGLPIIKASMEGHLEVVNYLLNNIQPDLKQYYAQTAICMASARGHINLVKNLVDNTDADPTFLYNYSLRKSLLGQHIHLVLYLNSLDIVKNSISEDLKKDVADFKSKAKEHKISIEVYTKKFGIFFHAPPEERNPFLIPELKGLLAMQYLALLRKDINYSDHYLSLLLSTKICEVEEDQSAGYCCIL